jgi:hypothetical protein
MGNLDSLYSPQPGLGGSHHLPLYSILCSSARRLHSNGTFSWDSQGGVPKLSRFGLPRLWASITSCSDLGLGWGLKQSCSSIWELSNSMSHSIRKSRIRGRFSTFSGLESNCQFDSRPFFCPQLGLQMSKWLMRGHFGHLHFKTFPMVSRTPQCEVFWPLNSNSKFLGVPEDFKFPLLGVWVSSSHLTQSGVATVAKGGF